MQLFRCVQCGKSFPPQGVKTLPFCSERCQQIDLGRWLNESYSFPSTRERDPEELADEQPRESED